MEKVLLLGLDTYENTYLLGVVFTLKQSSAGLDPYGNTYLLGSYYLIAGGNTYLLGTDYALGHLGVIQLNIVKMKLNGQIYFLFV